MRIFTKKEKRKESELLHIVAQEEETDSVFGENRKTMKHLCAPDGINPNPLDYTIIHDNGTDIYTMCFYIDKIPSRAKFASTFASVFNFPEVTSSVFINSQTEGKSSKQLNKRIQTLETEQVGAQKAQDRNRYRKITNKMQDAESYATDVEAGDNRLYEVSFLFTVQAVNLERLRIIVSDLHTKARTKGIELAACYSVHPEAFVSGYPTNRIFKAKAGIVSSNVIKKHVFDKKGLVTLFNHTYSHFSHKGGVVLGKSLTTGRLVKFDMYDASHDGFGLLIAGVTGTGKSTTLKILLSRYIDFGYKIRSIDFEARSTIGEYSLAAQSVGGVSYEIKQNSKNIMNIFEITEEEIFDEVTQREYWTLDLSQAIVNVSNLIMTMVKDGEDIGEFSQITVLKRLISDTVTELYSRIGIVDGEVESLYEVGTTIQSGVFSSGKRKKSLPTITDFYKLILLKYRENDDSHYTESFRLLLDAMKDYVKELYYCKKDGTFFTREEYEKVEEVKRHSGTYKKCPKCGGIIQAIRGVRAYFDGQSTIVADKDMPHINIDISQLTPAEKPVALLVAMNFIGEQCAKRNSQNPTKEQKMIFLLDEVHRVFPYPEARKFIEDAYRTYRKRNVSPWTATQSLADYNMYKETQTIFKNTACKLLLRHDTDDRDFLREKTILTDSEVERVLTLGGEMSETGTKRKGEVCLIDGNRTTFLRVEYLTSSEAKIAETDAKKIAAMYKGGVA